MLAAGLKGVEGNYKLPEPVEEDIFEMSEEERKKRGIDTLPGNLYEALTEVEKSELVRTALGDHIFEKFVANKKIELDKYRTAVTTWETDRYLSIM